MTNFQKNPPNGQILMTSYQDDELGIQAMVPMSWTNVAPGSFQTGWTPADFATLSITPMEDMSIEDLKAFVTNELILDELPLSRGIYKSPVLEWELYIVEIKIEELGILKGGVGMSSDEEDGHLVFIGAFAYEYDRNQSYYDTILTHTMHSYIP